MNWVPTGSERTFQKEPRFREQRIWVTDLKKLDRLLTKVLKGKTKKKKKEEKNIESKEIFQFQII